MHVKLFAQIGVLLLSRFYIGCETATSCEGKNVALMKTH